MSTLLISLVACLSCSLAHADSPAALYHFEIPAGDAQKTLLQFVTQSNIEMLYSSDDVHGITTHAVSGDFTVVQALRTMTDGTGLEITFENDFTFASVKPTAKFGTGPETTLTADVSTRDLARGTPDLPLQAFASEQKLEEVVVTGTLIHGVVDIMSPLQFVTRNDMKRSSYATVQDALQALPINVGGGPSEDFSGTGNFGRGVSVNLRGLGPGATLVLVNGHRQPFSGTQGDFVDVSNIPWNAVERIEVLPDGASALYGSDAVAGVVNVIMRKDLDGGESLVRFGASPSGADEKLIGQLFGTQWQNGRALFSYQYSERTSLAATERAYAGNSDKTALGGTDHRSYRSSPGNILDPRTLLPAYGIPAGQDGSALTVADLLPGSVNLQNRYATKELLPDRKMHSAYVSASQDVSDAVELFAEGRFSKSTISQQLYGFDQPLLVPSSNPFFVNPYSNAPFVVVGYNFLNDLGPIRVDADTETYGFAGGVKASLSDTWRLTVSGSYGRERLNSALRNQPDQAALGKALASSDPATAFNPFGDGRGNNPSTLAAIRSVQLDQAISTVTSATAVADGAVVSLPSGDAKLAIGSEWRVERFGNVVGRGTPFDRQVESAFAELSIPIIGDPNDVRAAPRLELSLADRFERYSDFGSTSNPKVGLRWALSESVKVRTSWGTSFRAPKLVDIYDSSHNTAVLTSLRDPTSSNGSSLVLALQGNNPHLKQETATTWTAGMDFVFQRLSGLTMSLTYYSIDYTDRVVVPGLASPTDVLLQEDAWAAAINRDPSRAEINAVCSSVVFRGNTAQCANAPIAAIVDFSVRNLAATNVKGLDLRLDQSLDTSLGNFALGLNGGYFLRFQQAVSKTSPRVNILNTVGNPLALRVRGTADWYQRSWNQPGFAVSAALDHSGGYRDIEMGRPVNPLTTLDLRVSYRTARNRGAFDDVEFSLNAANVFDKDPPFVDREEGYDIVNTDPYGRVVSFSIQKNW